MAVRLAIQPSAPSDTLPPSVLDTDAQLFAELLEEFGILRGDESDLAAVANWMRSNLGLHGVKALEAAMTSLLQVSPAHLARDVRPTTSTPPPDALFGGEGEEAWHVPIGGFGTSALRMQWRALYRDAEVLSYPEDGDFEELLTTVFRPLASACSEIVYIDRYLGHALVDTSPLRARPRLQKLATFLLDLIDAAEAGCSLELMTAFDKENCLTFEQVVEMTDVIVSAITEAGATRSMNGASITIYTTRNKMAVPHDRRFRFGRTVLNLASGHEVLPGGSNRTTMAGILPLRAWRETCREEQEFRGRDAVYAPPPILLA